MSLGDPLPSRRIFRFLSALFSTPGLLRTRLRQPTMILQRRTDADAVMGGGLKQGRADVGRISLWLKTSCSGLPSP